MNWCFRLRFNLGATAQVRYDQHKWVLCDGPFERVLLLPADGENLLTDARRLQVRGESYPTQAEAETAGRRWRDWMTLVLVSVNVGADFGDRATTGGASQSYLEELTRRRGHLVLNDVHGLMTFSCDPGVKFHSVGPVTLVVGSSHDRLVQALRQVQATRPELSLKDRLAYDLYSSSMSETNADARFVMLMMAVETLLEQRPKSAGAVALVDKFLAEVRQSNLPPSEIESLKGWLRHLRNESISQAGRNLAAKLPQDRVYHDEDPVAFFKECYNLRSQLVHGHDPRPGRDIVGLRAAHLESFVSDLLAEPVFPGHSHPGGPRRVVASYELTETGQDD